MKIAVLVSSCFLLASPVFAQQVKVVGPGSGSCAQFNEDLRRDPIYEREYFAWAQGLMSGILLRAPAGVDENVDLLPTKFPVAEQTKYIREFCAKNAGEDFFEAVRALYRAIKAAATKTNWRG